jgi:hypothetical protein
MLLPRLINSALLGIAVLLIQGPVYAHGGGLNAEGCHNNRKTGDYHCHRGPAEQLPQQERQFVPTDRRYVPLVPQEAQRYQLPCYVGPRGGTYTITPSGRKDYAGC